MIILLLLHGNINLIKNILHDGRKYHTHLDYYTLVYILSQIYNYQHNYLYICCSVDFILIISPSCVNSKYNNAIDK